MSEARRETVSSQSSTRAAGAEPRRTGISEPAAAAPSSAQSGVHATDHAQREAFSSDALHTMAMPALKARPVRGSVEAGVGLPPLSPGLWRTEMPLRPEPSASPESQATDAAMKRARSELLRIAGDEPGSSGPFDASEVTSQRIHPQLIAAARRDDHDEDTVVQNVAELLKVIDEKLDALTVQFNAAAPVEAPSVTADTAPDSPVPSQPASLLPAALPAPVEARGSVPTAPAPQEHAPAPLVLRAPPVRPMLTPVPDSDLRRPSRAWGLALGIGGLLALSALVLSGLYYAYQHPAGAPAPAAHGDQRGTSERVRPMAPQAVRPIGEPSTELAPGEPQGPRAEAPRAAPESSEPAADAATPGEESPAIGQLLSQAQASLAVFRGRDARAFARKAIALDIYNPHSHATLAEVELAMGLPIRAIVPAETAVKLRPKRARYHALLARVYKAVGRVADADAERAEAAVLEPSDPDHPTQR